MSVSKDKLENVQAFDVPGQLTFFIGYYREPEHHKLDGTIFSAHQRMQITTAGGIVTFSPEQIDKLREYLNSLVGAVPPYVDKTQLRDQIIGTILSTKLVWDEAEGHERCNSYDEHNCHMAGAFSAFNEAVEIVRKALK